MTRPYGRRAGGRRIHESAPGSHWKIMTILAAMRLGAVSAAMTIEEAAGAGIFPGCVEQVLCPTLAIGGVVVMDNLSSHKVTGVREPIEARGAEVLCLPPCSPGLNPIEKAWAKDRTRPALNSGQKQAEPRPGYHRNPRSHHCRPCSSMVQALHANITEIVKTL
jgi:transposase